MKIKQSGSRIYSQNMATAFRYNKRLDITLGLIKPYLNKQTNMLDLGCGDGAWLKYVAPYIGTGLGLDLGWSGAVDEWGCSPLNISFKKEDFTKSNLSDEKFDIVTCFETLEHVPDIEVVLKEMDRLLAPGGIAVISVPIEIGLSLMLKQLVAVFMGYKRSGDPVMQWRFMELVRAIFFFMDDLKERRLLSGHYGHKGFDYRMVEIYFKKKFINVQISGTPFPFFGRHLNVGVIIYGEKV